MNNWKQQKLGIVADVKLSNVDKLTIENERVVRLCNYTDVYKNSFINNEKSKSFMLASCNENEYEKFILKKGQVAITKDSETPNDIGVSTYISEDFEDVVLGYHLALITPDNDKLNGQFLHYWLNTKQAKRYFENNAGGSGQRCTLVLDCIKSTPLYLPKLSTQAKIAKVLSDLDNKIELNNRINRELETMAKTLYDYWFVQFDFPNEQGKPYKSSGGKMVYNAELKREIPEGWVVKKLNDTLRIVRGASPRPIDDYMAESGCPWIKISDATAINHWFIIGTKEYIKEEGVKSSRELQPGTLILSNSASPGIPKIVQIRACVHDGWLIVDSYKNGLYNEFMLFYFENFRSKIINMGSGSIFKNLKTEYIKDLNIAIPPIHLLEKSKVAFDNIYKQVLTNAIQNQQLTELRDWLLPMLMNGQVTVKEAEESLSMAAEPSVEYKKG